MNHMEPILTRLPKEFQTEITLLPNSILDQLEEIRLNTGQPMILYAGGKEYHIGKKTLKKIDPMMMNDIFHSILNHSVYAYQEELSKGYITMEGGSRVGICGKVIMEHGIVKAMKDITSLNIRRSKEFIGISDRFMPYLLARDGRLLHTLIVSPPKCGKTTLLRDMIRNLSGLGLRIGVCDERSEIAGIYHGNPSFDLGERTDILDGCPKEVGMVMLIRAMSPDVIATDEIGKSADLFGVESALSAGVSLLTTIHGSDYEDVLKSGIGSIVEQGIFQRLIFLTNNPKIGTVKSILGPNQLPIV